MDKLRQSLHHRREEGGRRWSALENAKISQHHLENAMRRLRDAKLNYTARRPERLEDSRCNGHQHGLKTPLSGVKLGIQELPDVVHHARSANINSMSFQPVR